MAQYRDNFTFTSPAGKEVTAQIEPGYLASSLISIMTETLQLPAPLQCINIAILEPLSHSLPVTTKRATHRGTFRLQRKAYFFKRAVRSTLLLSCESPRREQNISPSPTWLLRGGGPVQNEADVFQTTRGQTVACLRYWNCSLPNKLLIKTVVCLPHIKTHTKMAMLLNRRTEQVSQKMVRIGQVVRI
jgi:hypothetical protein